MHMHYPSKQTIIIFVVCIVAIAGMVIYVGGKAPQKQDVNIDQPSVFARAQNEFASTTVSTSTDWKSAFLDTSTSSKAFKTPAKIVATSTTDENLTATDKFGRGLFSQYVTLKQVGLDSNPEIVSSTIASLLAQTDAEDDKPKEYGMSNIQVNNDQSATALKQYGNTIGLLFKNYSPSKDDASLALAGMQGTDPAFVDELGANIVKYKVILSTLLNTSVPQSVSSFHLALVNDASAMIFIASAMQVSKTDPLRAIGGLKLYSSTFPSILQNMLSIRNALGYSGIVYAASDGGSFFKLPTQ